MLLYPEFLKIHYIYKIQKEQDCKYNDICGTLGMSHTYPYSAFHPILSIYL